MRSAAEMKAVPPAHERQQAMCVGVQSLVGKSADILAIEDTDRSTQHPYRWIARPPELD
jgi:hypothetical protein